jgi:hypothetical protein
MKIQRKAIMTIAPDGTIKIETLGFIGKSCTEETQFLKDMLGDETARELKPVYFQKNGIETKRHIPLCG